MSVLKHFLDERKKAIHFKQLFEVLAKQENQSIDVVAAFFHRHKMMLEKDDAGFDVQVPAYKCYTYSRISGFDAYPDQWFQERCFDLIKALAECYDICNEEMPINTIGYSVLPDEINGLPDDYQGFFEEFYFHYDEIKSFLYIHELELPSQFHLEDSDSSLLPLEDNEAQAFEKVALTEASNKLDNPDKTLATRERNNLHAIIGGLLLIVLKKDKRNQTYVINQLQELFGSSEPFSERNLERLFPHAKASLKDKGHDFDEMLDKK